MKNQEQPASGFTDVPKIIAEEDVDILSYMDWTEFEQVSLFFSAKDSNSLFMVLFFYFFIFFYNLKLNETHINTNIGSLTYQIGDEMEDLNNISIYA